MIKLIITDFSGVCSFNEESVYVRRFAKKNNLDPDDFERAYIELVQPAERGEFDAPKLWQKLAKKYNLKIDVEKEINTMMALKKYYFDVLNFYQNLRNKYKVAMYSNYCKTYCAKIVNNIDLNKYFDYFQFSFMVKARKTERQGFEIILKKFGVKPEEAVFIDDSESNLQAPKEMGMETILYNNLRRLEKELSKIINIQ